jgi:hypothetical protein
MAYPSSKTPHRVNHKRLKDADRERKEEIAEQHRRLREDFLARDAVRFPKGWRLPRGR